MTVKRWMITLAAFCAAVWGGGTPGTAAAAPEFTTPLACTPGVNCYVAVYFDHGKNAGGGAADYACGDLSKPGFIATEFVVSASADATAPLAVAAEAGVVLVVRDGMQDSEASAAGGEAVRGRECGNGVTVDHGRGYVTQYCHLKRGSIKVKAGEHVDRGAVLGEAGRSGGGEVAGLRFTVTRGGVPLDPFTGEEPTAGGVTFPCGAAEIYPLWDPVSAKALRYAPAAVTAAGFAVSPPSAEGARLGKFRASGFSVSDKFLVFWADVLGAKPGHILVMRVVGPDGTVLRDEKIPVAGVEEGALRFRHIVLRRPGNVWTPGEYTGFVRLESGGEFSAGLAEGAVKVTAGAASVAAHIAPAVKRSP